MSDETSPNPENLRTVQVWLNYLDGISEEEPEVVIDSTEGALPLLATWTTNDAYAWALALRAKAFRFLDSLSDVLLATEAGLASLRGDEHVAAHLHLEAGMALNQFGRAIDAVEHLEAAARTFAAKGDECGQAWALVSLAEAFEGSGLGSDSEALLKLALTLAANSGDERAERRAWKQLAVTYRHRGRPAEAIDAIGRALKGDMSNHTRANYLLEFGHLKAWLGDYSGSDGAYQDALIAYTEHADLLGQANVERALATNALLLGRLLQGERRLDRAAELYRQIGSNTGLGYVLRERAILLLARGDFSGAIRDIERGLRCFRATSDTFGLSSMLSAAIRVRHTVGDLPGVELALHEVRTMIENGTNPLTEAGLLLLQAEIGDSAISRLESSLRSSQLYNAMGIRTGEASALSRLALSYADLGEPDSARASAIEAKAILRLARQQVADPGRRGDHDVALRNVSTSLLTVAVRLNDAKLLADLIVDEAPIGLRRTFHYGHLDAASENLLSRFKVIEPKTVASSVGRASLIQQINTRIAFVDPNENPLWIDFQDLADAHPEEIVLAYGSPTSEGKLPIAWRLPGESTQAALTPLDDMAIEQIDVLGYAFDAGHSHVLWAARDRSWQHNLARVLLPSPVIDFVLRENLVSIAVLFPPILAHIPFEALLVDSQPIGIRAAVVRLTVPTTTKVEPILQKTVAYLDAELNWGAEWKMRTKLNHDPEYFRNLIGSGRLVFIGSHGETALRAEGALVTSDGSRVIDALDLLSRPLSNSIVVIAACNAGRYMGPRAGEQLHLATISLISGASSSIAGLFALPSSDLCTGLIADALIRELESGVHAPEALRRARESYWLQRPSTLRVPDRPVLAMSGDAPWAWAGLCAFSR